MGLEHLAVADRFWSYVDRGRDDDCWEWNGARYPKGYGAFAVRRKVNYTHRISWALTNGPIPDGTHIRHTCDNPPCVNPAHLLSGTRSDNMQDCSQRGRMNLSDRRGTANGRARLTPDEVRTIRARAAAGQSVNSLAKEFGVTETAARYIVIRRNWAHIE